MSKSSFEDIEDATIVAQLVDRQHKLVRARFKRSMGRLEDTASIGGIRREIAQMKTELRRREIVGGLPNGEIERRHVAGVARPVPSEQASSGGLLAGAVDKLSQ
jgi:ribosomal protein L29